MRLLYANSFYAPHVTGGAEVITQTMAEGMAACGHEVSVVATADQASRQVLNGVDVFKLKQQNIFWKLPHEPKPGWQKLVWHAVDSRNRFMRAPIDRLLDQTKPDVLVSNNLSGLSVALWEQAAARRIPIVHVLHDYYLMCPSVTMYKAGQNCQRPCGRCKTFRRPHADLSNKVTAVVGVSSAILNRHLDSGLFAKTRIKRVIYNARDLSPPTERVPTEGTDLPIFGYLGGLTEVKGIKVLISAFNQARQALPGLRLLVAGSGEDDYVNELRAMAGPGIEFLGKVNAFEFFKRIDVSVAPSLWHDPLPGVVFEALSQGVPVIGARRGGIPEMVQDGKNGILFEPDAADELRSAILRVASNRKELELLTAEANPSSANFCSMSRVLSDYQNLMQEVANV